MTALVVIVFHAKALGREKFCPLHNCMLLFCSVSSINRDATKIVKELKVEKGKLKMAVTIWGNH